MLFSGLEFAGHKLPFPSINPIMTQVDFYILKPNSSRNIEYVTCQITEKAIAQGKTVYIQANDLAQANHIDELLWKYKPESFVPHRNFCQQLPDPNSSEPPNIDPDLKSAMDFEYPVVISMGQYAIDNYDQVLINLSTEVPLFFSRFERMAEMVCDDDDLKQKARERYRFYQERGYPLNKFDI